MAFPYYMGCKTEPASKPDDTAGGYTYVFAEVCPDGGYISKIEIYVSDDTQDGFQFAVFSRSGSNFTDLVYKQNLSVSLNLNTFNEGTDFATNLLPIETGQYF